MDAARNRGLVFESATEATEFATHGVRARFDGHDVVVGKPEFVAESGARRRGGWSWPAANSPSTSGVAGEFAGRPRDERSHPQGRPAARSAELKALGVTPDGHADR